MTYDTAARSEAKKAQWRDPAIRARWIAGMLASWDDPMRLALARKGFRCGHPDIEDDARTSRGDGCRLCTRERQKRWHRMKGKRTEGTSRFLRPTSREQKPTLLATETLAGRGEG